MVIVAVVLDERTYRHREEALERRIVGRYYRAEASWKDFRMVHAHGVREGLGGKLQGIQRPEEANAVGLCS